MRWFDGIVQRSLSPLEKQCDRMAGSSTAFTPDALAGSMRVPGVSADAERIDSTSHAARASEGPRHGLCVTTCVPHHRHVPDGLLNPSWDGQSELRLGHTKSGWLDQSVGCGDSRGKRPSQSSGVTIRTPEGAIRVVGGAIRRLFPSIRVQGGCSPVPSVPIRTPPASIRVAIGSISISVHPI
jgi:hypothetical protein